MVGLVVNLPNSCDSFKASMVGLPSKGLLRPAKVCHRLHDRVLTPIMRHLSKIISYSFKDYVISKLPLQAQITLVALHLTNLNRYNF